MSDRGEARAATGGGRGSATPARAVALEILRRIEEEDAYPDPLLDHLPGRAHLPARDRALVMEVVYGTLRWQRWLDWHLGRVTHRPLAELPAWARALLRASAYQLAFLDRVPPWAAVNEAVELAKRRRPRGVAPLVNAVLRVLAGTPRPWPAPTSAVVGDELEALGIQSSHPSWLLARWLARLGAAEAAALARAMNDRPPLVLRVNSLKTTAEALIDALAGPGARVERCRYAPDGIRVTGAGDPRELAPLRAGDCAVQDEAAILVGHVLAPEPGETVADVCAAPGTKTTHLAQLMANRGRVLAVDRHPGRVERLRAACRRMGATIVEPRVATVDALARETGPVCDRVLVDAPCSNLGVLRRNPDAKWRRQPGDLAALAAAQAEIVDAAAALVRPGGVLVYATCSLEPEENEGVVEAFRARWPAFVPDPIPAGVDQACLERPERLRTYPHRHDTDGFTAVRLRRRP